MSFYTLNNCSFTEKYNNQPQLTATNFRISIYSSKNCSFTKHKIDQIPIYYCMSQNILYFIKTCSLHNKKVIHFQYITKCFRKSFYALKNCTFTKYKINPATTYCYVFQTILHLVIKLHIQKIYNQTIYSKIRHVSEYFLFVKELHINTCFRISFDSFKNCRHPTYNYVFPNVLFFR